MKDKVVDLGNGTYQHTLTPDDPISAFVQESHKEKGPHCKLKMKKEQGTAGFCLKASGSPDAMKRLADIMNGIDLGKHQLPEDEG